MRGDEQPTKQTKTLGPTGCSYQSWSGANAPHPDSSLTFRMTIPMQSKDKLVKVYTAQGELEAQVIKSLLESCSIPSLLQGNAALSIQPFVMDGMGKIDIMVASALAEEARKIIEAKADV